MQVFETRKLKSLIADNKLLSIFLVGIVVRLILMPISAHPFDVYSWYMLSNGDSMLYPQFFPPFWFHYMMVPIGYIYNWFSSFLPTGTLAMSSLPDALNFYPEFNILYVPGLLFNFIVKMPFFISDVLIAWLLYKIIRERTGNKGYGEKAAFLWFLNPFVIWISSAWGMWDSLAALFSLLCLTFMLKRRLVLSAVCLSIGVALKLYPLLFLIPLCFYIYKTGSNRQLELLRFVGIFFVSSLLLFLPYMGMIPQVFDSFAIPTSDYAANAVANPVAYPIGFGLTFWSLSLLNRLSNIPLSIDFVVSLSIISILMVLVALMVVYWKSNKIAAQKPLVSITVMMVLSLIAFFLTYRIICEQWLIWALPLIVILCVVGRVKGIYYWSVSFLALLFAVVNCPLPLFFLPLAPWIGDGLVIILNSFLSIEPLRITVLAILGCLLSIFMVLIARNAVKNSNEVDISCKTLSSQP